MEDSYEGATQSNWDVSETNSNNDLPVGLYGSGYGGNYSSRVAIKVKKDTTLKNKKLIAGTEKKTRIGLKYMEILSSKKSQDIIIELISQKLEFHELLNDKGLTYDLVFIIIDILSTICDSNFMAIKADMLSITQNVFLYTLYSYVNNTYKENEKLHTQSGNYCSDVKRFWNNLSTYLKYMINIMSMNHTEIIGKILAYSATYLMHMVKNRQYNYEFNDIYKKYEDLQKKFLMCSKNLDECVSNTALFTYEEIYPKVEDLNNYDQNLQPLLIRGAYSNIKDYLEIHSKLIKEDFLIPFRKGINDFKMDVLKNLPQTNSVCRFYKNVIFIEETMIQNKLCLVICIADSKTSSPHVSESNNYMKHFMYGSLLCLSWDNFNTLLFATVEGREDLSRGYLVIRLCEVYDISGMFSRTNFVMLESEVYFEPYFHVLSALSQFNEDNFPMEDYLIKAQARTKFPEYSLDVLNYKFKEKELSILNTEDWPHPIDVGLNSSQLEAIKAALTNDLILIQGPPGTGKTFIGIEIAKILLNNIKRPRLVIICYTNQALDQFLIGLTPLTNDIIRIGNQSAEPSLSKYHISRKKHAKSNTLSKALRQIESEILQILKYIKINQCTLKVLNSCKGIISMNSNKFATELKIANWLPSSSTLLTPLANWLLGTSKDNALELSKYTKNNQIISESHSVQNQEIDLVSLNLRSVETLDDFDVAVHNFNVISEFNFDITIESLQNSICKLDQQIRKRSQQQINNEEYLYELKQEKEELQFWLQHLIIRMIAGTNSTKNVAFGSNGASLNFEARWSLYWQWLELLKNDYIKKAKSLNSNYRQLSKQFEELKFIQYINILKDSQVIGMTTTSAARLQMVLKELKIPIVILEEAAEIPEAHAVTSLTKYCQHLIMIGDHKQLQPQNAVHTLSENYNLNISLFERLLNNGVQCYTLNEQYRMRPEIASLLTPIFYNSLLNNMSVTKYPAIRGLTKNLYFITHNHFEETNIKLTSHSNKHEAKFIIKLCQYLLLNNYKASDVIILTTYSGQMVTIQNGLRNIAILKNVKVAVVDNYQGQENKIILLSLVRSNKEGNIGFLMKENRICVALSRAKEGLFIIGNMDNLSARSEIWSKIETVLASQGAIGDHLVLKFQQTSRIFEFKVMTAEDFDQPIMQLS